LKNYEIPLQFYALMRGFENEYYILDGVNNLKTNRQLMSTIDKQGERACNVERHRLTYDFASTVLVFTTGGRCVFVLFSEFCGSETGVSSFFFSISSLFSTRLVLVEEYVPETSSTLIEFLRLFKIGISPIGDCHCNGLNFGLRFFAYAHSVNILLDNCIRIVVNFSPSQISISRRALARLCNRTFECQLNPAWAGVSYKRVFQGTSPVH